MHAWNWLLLAILVAVLVLGWRLNQELRDTRRRAFRLRRRVKRLRQLIVLDRLDRLEREVGYIEDVVIRRGQYGGNSGEFEGAVMSYVATCRSFVQRSTEDGKSRDEADAVVRVVLGHLVRGNPGHYARLGLILSKDEYDRWLRQGSAE